MPIRFRVQALGAMAAAALALAAAGCSLLRPAPPPAAPPPLETTDSGAARTYLGLANGREDEADWPGAQAAVDKGLAQQPASRALLLRRAQILLHRSEDEDAPDLREEARAILARFADDADAETRATQAWLLFDDGRRDEAIRAARAAADADPSSARVQRILARLLLANGDYRDARDAAQRALEIGPRSGSALRVHARTQIAVADVASAEADAREALRMHRDDPEASAILADTMLRQANVDGAKRVLDAVPRQRRTVRVWVPLARIEIGGGHADAARALLEEAVTARPNDASVHEVLVALDIREGRASDSVARLDAAVAARPDDAALHRLRAQALVAAGRDDDARASFVRSLSLDRNDLATYRALIVGWSAGGPDAQSERRAAELGAEPGPTSFATGLVRDARGDHAGAIAQFQRAIEVDPSLAVARSALARALAASGTQLDQALVLAREAHTARPRDPEIADTLGLVQLRHGDGRAALESFSQAAGTLPVGNPGYADVLYHTSLAFDAVHDRDGARRTAQVAIALVGDRKPEPAWVASARSFVKRNQPAKSADAPEPAVANSGESPAATDAGGASGAPASAPAPTAPSPESQKAESAPAPTPKPDAAPAKKTPTP